MNQPTPSSLVSRALAAVTTLMVIAVGARLVWELFRPLLGLLVVIAVLVLLVGLVIRRGRW